MFFNLLFYRKVNKYCPKYRIRFEKMGFKNKRPIVVKICKDADFCCKANKETSLSQPVIRPTGIHMLGVIQLKIRSHIHTNH